jgi:hypothetical protein
MRYTSTGSGAGGGARRSRRLLALVAALLGAGAVAGVGVAGVWWQDVPVDTTNVRYRLVHTTAGNFDSGWHIHPGLAIVQVQKGTLQTLAIAIAVTVVATGGPTTAATSLSPSQRLARLYQLQVAFHRAASVHSPDGADSAAMIDRRIKQMLSLWTADGSLTLSAVTPAREFKGRGELGTASCAPGAGTLCDFFKNVAGSFKPQARRRAPLG